MESLLPSEIARLVLGYLKDHKLDDAANLFLQTSPLLEECRIVVAKGKSFNTRASGLRLTDILEKYCAASVMVQEKLSKAMCCDQIKHCGDLVEQLRFLLEGSLGQRFVVNINVPSQNTSLNASVNAPATPGSARKRHVSGAEYSKQGTKSANHELDKPSKCNLAQSCTDVEATPLDSLPGHTNPLKSDSKRRSNLIHEKSSPNKTDASSTIHSPLKDRIYAACSHRTMTNLEIINSSVENEYDNHLRATCSTATNTEEFISYSNQKVQTYNLLGSESEEKDRPIENLSLLTKELLNRHELHERIAETINKTIQPVETSFREDNYGESAGEQNTSIMAEINNAIKAIVHATENDPVFEDFLQEVIGPCAETDTSPDEDIENKGTQELDNQDGNGNEDLMDIDYTCHKDNTIDSIIRERSGTEVPLKQRLRGSSKTQNAKNEDEEKENSTLESQNAEAVMNIINANVSLNKNPPEELVEAPKPSDLGPKFTKTIPAVAETKASVPTSLPKKSTTRKRAPKPKLPVIPEPVINEQDIITVPTLILCSEEEIKSCASYENENLLKTSTPFLASQYLPIAPKLANQVVAPPLTPKLFLKTVNVPQTIKPNSMHNALIVPNTSQKTIQHQFPTNTPLLSSPFKKIINAPVPTENKQQSLPESITLYGSEHDSGMKVVATNMPIISIDDSISLTGTGLSPFCKPNVDKTEEPLARDLHMPSCSNASSEKTISPFKSTGKSSRELIARRTPRSLLKSRAKNHRLSLSTPRRCNSHVRALDFNTPTKIVGSCKTTIRTARRSRSVCRSSLFKSPSYSKSNTIKITNTTVKTNSAKVCQSYKIPIATRSPAPKLKGDWDKYTGVGMILEEEPSSCETSFEKSESNSPRVEEKLQKSWDSDLRNTICSNEEEQLTKLTKGADGDKSNNVQTKTKSDNLDSAAFNEKKSKKNTDEKKNPLTNSCNNEPSDFEINVDVNIEKETSIDQNSGKLDTVMLEKLSPRFPLLLDLETPTKEMSLIPPTPRLLPPDHHAPKFYAKVGEKHKIQDIIETPEFPLTPCIAITPKLITEDHLRKASPYYEPSIKNEDEIVIKKITQFEVIKENISEDDATKEVNTSSTLTSNSSNDSLSKEKGESDSSVSDTSTSSTSSSSSNTLGDSTSLNSSTTLNNSSSKEIDSLNNTDISPIIQTQVTSEIKENQEISPTKEFSVSMPPEEEYIKETPAKIKVEAVISETPYGTKSGMETITNLASKLLTSVPSCEKLPQRTMSIPKNIVSNSNEEKRNLGPGRPKITNIRKVVSESVSEVGNGGIDVRSTLKKIMPLSSLRPADAKLCMELEEKRLRVVARFKEDTKPKSFYGKIPKKVDQNLTENLKNRKSCGNTVKDIKEEKTKNTGVENKDHIKGMVDSKQISKSPKRLNLKQKPAILSDNSELEAKSSKSLNIEVKKNIEAQQYISKDISCLKEDTKAILKSKVDQIKRDLFSDEEAANQRTTRSRSRRFSEVQKSDNESNDNVIVENSKEKMDDVLESLKLVPSNKIENEPVENNLSNDISVTKNTKTENVVYDETVSVPIKKRKRQYSGSELEDQTIEGAGGESFILKVTPFVEIYGMAPKHKKKVTNSKSPTKAYKNKKSTEKTNVCKEKNKLDKVRSKSRKRKTVSPLKEEKLVGKKLKTTDAQELLVGVDLDKFLTTLHGPA